ncbi:MAG TPA: hypothetical protein VMV04_09930 [Thermodesulfobacteriota bacterium]|nr:hypothetical protein [Thermodesulfobacteriota bacterium]
MREEMVLAWGDFFEKNPGKKEEDIWRRIEERLRSKQDSKEQGETVPSVKLTLSEKRLNRNGSTEANVLRRSGKIAPLILKRRIWWELVLGASSYVVYVTKDRTVFEPDHFSWETTPGIISKLIVGKTELVIPDGWPEFPKESGTYYIGITSRDDIGNQSAPLLLSGLFRFFAPPAPSRGGIE